MNATWLPSGEKVGDHAFPGRVVSGTTVSLWSSYSRSSRSIFGFIHGYSDPAMTTQAAAAIVALRFHHCGLGGLSSSLGGLGWGATAATPAEREDSSASAATLPELVSRFRR